MKAWILTEQVNKLWTRARDRIAEIKACGDDNRLDKLRVELAAELAAVIYLFVNTQADIKDFVKTADGLSAAVSAWITTEISADRADQIGTVKIQFIPGVPDKKAPEDPGQDTPPDNPEGEPADAEPPGSD